MSVPGNLYTPTIRKTKTPGGFDVPNAIHFSAASSQYFTRTPGAAGNTKTWTVSVWFRLGALGTERRFINAFVSGGTGCTQLGLTSTGTLIFDSKVGSFENRTTRVLRDPGAYYHAVFGLDTTQTTGADRYKLELNGVDISSELSGTKPTLDAVCKLNDTVLHTVGAYNDGATSLFYDGNFIIDIIDGQKLDASYFGEFDENGVWRPIDVSGLTFGTNGFHLSTADGVDAKNDAVSTIYTLGSSAWTGDTGDFTTLARDIVAAGGNVGGIYHNNTFAGACAVEFQWQGGANPAYLHLFANSEVGSFSSSNSGYCWRNVDDGRLLACLSRRASRSTFCAVAQRFRPALTRYRRATGSSWRVTQAAR
jgi:hypothetical protein